MWMYEKSWKYLLRTQSSEAKNMIAMTTIRITPVSPGIDPNSNSM